MNSSLHDPNYRAFVTHLITLRKAAGMTQATLAKKLSKPQSFVSKMERFERRIDPAEFRQIVNALGFDAVKEFEEVSGTL